MQIKIVENKNELRAILAIQEENHFKNLTSSTIANKGFVTVKHTSDMLQKMNTKTPQIIAKCKGEVVGYALAMLQESKDLIPVLMPMFTLFETILYQGQPLNNLNYYVMGQICVKDGFKRQGVFKKLYLKHKDVYAKKFDYCVTEVSSNNVPSMIAHQKVGFKVIHTFMDAKDEWHILLWDWQ